MLLPTPPLRRVHRASGVVRRAFNASSVRVASSVLPAPRQDPGQQRRGFLTDRAATMYWMKRAKILQIVGRMIVAYPQMHNINDPNAAINRLFAKDAGERERAFMFVLSQLPPDEAIDLHEFLHGAQDAARVVYETLYNGEDGGFLAQLATPACLEQWQSKVEQQRKTLALDATATLTLDRLDFQDVSVSEVNYTYGDAKEEEERTEDATASRVDDSIQDEPTHSTTDEPTAVPRPHSKFLMYEAMELKVQYDVVEHLQVHDGSNDPRNVAFRTTFQWAFDTDVSRAELVDWVITESSSFASALVEDEETEDSQLIAANDTTNGR
ncbi:hypothetical protein Poli38472_013263 [Pythium oligandrum]|uniref:Tim44-like domain-containing protein n=1 Tax=Pythium oligandrum TaxID=41045 RepID=A0A8K1C2R5_PYTOL|nr:hypothetical protein Poli38472_013263 [Pythium oligandrum]|eukprot:TMW55372.1 hypothetical protein Poli38472_013263 [Pythium oligandrum]